MEVIVASVWLTMGDRSISGFRGGREAVLTIVVTTTSISLDETAGQLPEQTTPAMSRRGSISRPAAHGGPAWAPRRCGSQARRYLGQSVQRVADPQGLSGWPHVRRDC